MLNKKEQRESDLINADIKGGDIELWWVCKYCGENEQPKCHKCVREDGKLVEDELMAKVDLEDKRKNNARYIASDLMNNYLNGRD